MNDERNESKKKKKKLNRKTKCFFARVMFVFRFLFDGEQLSAVWGQVPQNWTTPSYSHSVSSHSFGQDDQREVAEVIKLC